MAKNTIERVLWIKFDQNYNKLYEVSFLFIFYIVTLFFSLILNLIIFKYLFKNNLVFLINSLTIIILNFYINYYYLRFKIKFNTNITHGLLLFIVLIIVKGSFIIIFAIDVTLLYYKIKLQNFLINIYILIPFIIFSIFSTIKNLINKTYKDYLFNTLIDKEKNIFNLSYFSWAPTPSSEYAWRVYSGIINEENINSKKDKFKYKFIMFYLNYFPFIIIALITLLNFFNKIKLYNYNNIYSLVFLNICYFAFYFVIDFIIGSSIATIILIRKYEKENNVKIYTEWKVIREEIIKQWNDGKLRGVGMSKKYKRKYPLNKKYPII